MGIHDPGSRMSLIHRSGETNVVGSCDACLSFDRLEWVWSVRVDPAFCAHCLTWRGSAKKMMELKWGRTGGVRWCASFEVLGDLIMLKISTRLRCAATSGGMEVGGCSAMQAGDGDSFTANLENR